MRQTLFVIPHQIELAGHTIPLFGWGLLIVLWGLFSVVLLAVMLRRHGGSREVTGLLPVLLLVAAAIVFLLPALEISYEGQVIGLPIRGYGVMLLAGVVSGVWLAAWRARRMGLDPEVIFSLAFWMFLAGIVGARLFYVIQKWPQFQSDNLWQLLGKVLNATSGGLVVYGSVIGGVVAAWLYLRRRHLPALAVADLIAPSMALGLALGRLGCLLNGCCYGGVCDLPWAISFPRRSNSYQQGESPPYAQQRQTGWLLGLRVWPDAEGWPIVTAVVPTSAAAAALDTKADSHGRLREPLRVLAINGVDIARAWEDLSPGDQAAIRPVDLAYDLLASSGPEIVLAVDDGRQVGWSIDALPAYSRPVHPTQIYSSINAALLCLLTLAVYPYRRRDGEVFALLVVLYGVTRFLLEIIRTDEGSVLGTGLTISQNVSLLLVAAAVLGWLFYLRKQPTRLALPPAGAA